MTEEGFLQFNEVQVASLYSDALAKMNAEALGKRIYNLAIARTTPQVGLTTWLGDRVQLSVYFNDGSSARERVFATREDLLTYLEHHDAEAIKAEYGYRNGTPGVLTTREREERAQRAAEKKAMAEARAKLESDWAVLAYNAGTVKKEVR